jgi:hypothetical protein
MRMIHSMALVALTVPLLAGTAHAAGTFTLLKATLNGDDQFKIYLSTTPMAEGFQYANGWGWPISYSDTLWLPQIAVNQNYKDYWLNIWVQDVGGGGPDLLGEFKLSGKPGCKFDNGSSQIVTGSVQPNGVSYWLVTPALPISGPGTPAAGYPAAFTNYLPPWKQPTLIPADLGANGTLPWGPMPQISAAAHWISDPGQTSQMEAWFSTHIHCK